MTPAEVVISVVGLIAGYWLVSNFITGSKSASRRDDGAKVEDIERVTLANWYQILEVAEAANREEISSAYKRKISQYHPDKVAQMGPEIRAVADAKSQQINAAYELGMKRFE